MRRVFSKFEIYRLDVLGADADPPISDEERAVAERATSGLTKDDMLPTVEVGDYVLFPEPRPETIAGVEEIWPILSVRQRLDLSPKKKMRA